MRTVGIIFGLMGVVAWVMVIIAAWLAREPRWWRCAWCNRWLSDLGESEEQMPECMEGVPVSHGICAKCKEKEMRDMERIRGVGCVGQVGQVGQVGPVGRVGL